MKKLLSLILSSVLLCTALSITAMAESNISVYVDNELTELMDVNGNAVHPFIQNGTTYIPVRGISQALDCIVEWDGDNQNVMIYKNIETDNKVFRNNSDDVKLYVDNEEQKLYDANGLEVKPFIKDGTTYVPLRGVSKVLGYPVEWEGQTKSVYVWKECVPPQGVTIDFLHPVEICANKIAYESQGETIEISGEKYTNAIDMYTWYQDGEVSFELNGKYNSLSCVLGHTGRYDLDKRVTFIVDGKIVDTVELKANSDIKPIKIELNKGLRLTIKDDDTCYFGLGDITFYGE